MVESRNAAQLGRTNVMTSKSRVRNFLKMLLIVAGVSAIACAQTPADQTSIPQFGTEQYWTLVDEFADRIVNFAYTQYFVQVHEGSLTERQCQQYSQMAVDYAEQLESLKQIGVSAHSEFWNDVRAYSVSMVGPAGVPIPDRRTRKYRVTTGSEAEDHELRRIVSLEIEEARSQLIGGYSPSDVKANCRTAPQALTALAEQ